MLTYSLLLIGVVFSGIAISSQNITSPPSKYGIVVFPGFQALDVFGPLDVLNMLSLEVDIDLVVLAATKDPVSTRTPRARPGTSFAESLAITHTFEDAPKDLEVLLIPGGYGTRVLNQTAPVREYIKKVFPNLRYVITVCTGAGLFARTGLLDGRRATGNKKYWDWVVSQGPKVQWVPKARWVEDETAGQIPIWTSSGVSAGLDVTFAFVKKHYGEDIASGIANTLEYERHLDSTWDPFSAVWNATWNPKS
ncbi:class I glutamine amidotransferase-like protein [Microthyrium microscopicum]|uniref:Class I glutamine amidotransferase-like protein n=1 Tax=Microthyrium microscopicum TaxID=703497 RepID=A0A6A6UGM0_9PEZI|nr:class I glutamine amidotransferase-like protein [Microthyrium microscopicum]